MGVFQKTVVAVIAKTMDLKSLLILPDDILCDILSYMPVKSRVKHSRTCGRMHDVMEESLRAVKVVEYMQGRDLIEDMHIDSKLKTLSKLKHLRVFSQPLPLKYSNRWLDVMTENCHKIEVLNCFDVRHVASFVRRLRVKDIPVSLKAMDVFFRDSDSDEDGREELMQCLHEFDKGIIISGSCFNMVASDSDLISKVTEFKNFYQWDLVINGENALQTVARMSNLRTIRSRIKVAHHLETLLDSLPLLTYIEVEINDKQMLPLLIRAKQKFTGLLLAVAFESDDEGDNNDEPEVDFHHMELLLQKNGRHLRELTLDLREVGDTDVIQLLTRTCFRLKEANISHKESNGLDKISVEYQDESLSATIPRGQSLSSLFVLFPRVREISISYADEQTLDLWVTELREFASTKRRYCIKAEISVTFGESSNSFESNLRLSVCRSCIFDDSSYDSDDDYDGYDDDCCLNDAEGEYPFYDDSGTSCVTNVCRDFD